MNELEPMRALLFVELVTACGLYAHLVGVLWQGRSWNVHRALLWAIRTTLVGLAGLLIYVTSGQIKAVQLDVPFDTYAWAGLAAGSVLDVGLAWLIRERRRREWG